MWLGLLRILCVISCLYVMADEAMAQQQQTTTQPVYGQAVLPAPTIEPAMSQQDQMARALHQANAQEAAQQNAGTFTNAPGMPPMQQQQMLVPQNGQVMMPSDQQQVAAPIQELTGQQQAQPQILPQTAATQPVAAAPAATTSTAPVVAKKEAPVVPITATATNAASITNTTGFAPDVPGKTLPLNSGMMPATNPGMDMSINSNLVGGNNGYDPNLPPGPGNAVPYEVQLEQRTQEIQQKARAQAFEQAKKSALPMETYEIRDVLGRLKDTQEAIQTPVRPAPKPGNVIRTISTDPSAKPKMIHLAAGNVTTMNIVDVTGAPWPIVDIGFGGPFDVKPPEPGGHVIRITPLKDFARGNLVVRLLKMTTPLTFSLQAGGDTVDYRFDARIPEYGPNAKMPLIAGGIESVAGDQTTTSFLEGVPPTGAEKLTVDGVDARTSAYRMGGNLYVRTPLSLLSPSWQGSATSADGMNVYVLNDAPVILLSDKGTLVRAKLGESKKTTMGF